MTYLRVLPRDLFNESKLLKCVGKIALLVEDGRIDGLTMEQDCYDGFQIEQDENSGNIFISNICFFDSAGREAFFYTGLNSKEHWPLILTYRDQEYFPLNDSGQYQLADDLFSGV